MNPFPVGRSVSDAAKPFLIAQVSDLHIKAGGLHATIPAPPPMEATMFVFNHFTRFKEGP